MDNLNTSLPILISDLRDSWGLQLPDVLTAEELETLLAERLNEWVRNDFSGLVQLLYRIDVDEAKLRYYLQQDTEEDAGRILARLIIERQYRKIETRRQYTPPKADDSGEERW